MLLEGKNLTLTYDVGKEIETNALNNVSVRIEKKQLIAITGPSGGGKSSLLYTLSGLREPTVGEVIFRGESLYKLSRDRRANIRKEKFGFVFQKHFLIDYLNVMDNVLIMYKGDTRKRKAEVELLLEKLKIEQISCKKIYQLSVGQRQRVAIARALIAEPDILFADEPTASLDAENSKLVMGIFKEYSKKATVLLISHDKDVIHYADRIIEINNAEVSQDKDI